MKKFIFLFLLCGCGITNITPRVSSNSVPYYNVKYPEYLSVADAFIGSHEINDRRVLEDFMGVDPVRYEWCAAFVNAVLHISSIPGSETVSDNPLMARSFLKWGTSVETPRMGDIVVFARGNQGWQGHVGIYIRTFTQDGQKYYLVLGGNQDDEVNYKAYPADKVLGFRRWVE